MNYNGWDALCHLGLDTKREGWKYKTGRLKRSGVQIGKVGKTQNGKVEIEGACKSGRLHAHNWKVEIEAASEGASEGASQPASLPAKNRFAYDRDGSEL